MKYLNKFLVLFMSISFLNCTTQSVDVVNLNDYANYLKTDLSEETLNQENERAFWSNKLKKAPNQYPYLGKIAAVESNLFELTGKIDHLIAAEEKLILLNKRTTYNNANHLSALARNYISQHRFKEALELLKKGEENGEKLSNTQKMLFDVHLELGNYKQAEEYLMRFKNENDFGYLIRLSKWHDHNGILISAIHFMEKASKLAEQSKNKSLIQWSYSNLADFYGHANRIDDSYRHYLKALALNPHDAYAKKGIAWILYSHERNPKEALAVLNSITNHYNAPDYYLLKAEIAEYLNDTDEKKKNIDLYVASTKNKNYGFMYSKYDVLVQAEELNNMDEAKKIAHREIVLRPTPQSYDLLAWSYYLNGEFSKALDMVQNNIVDKTFEPTIQYHIAEIYKANGMEKPALKIKKELLESTYELGPLMERKIALL